MDKKIKTHIDARCWQSLVLQLPLMTIIQLINIAALRHFRHMTTQKVFSFRGLGPPDQGLCPWTTLGAQPQDPRYRLALRARHMDLYASNLFSWIRPWSTATVDCLTGVE